MVSEGELSGLLRVDASADLSSAREATLRDALGAAREQRVHRTEEVERLMNEMHTCWTVLRGCTDEVSGEVTDDDVVDKSSADIDIQARVGPRATAHVARQRMEIPPSAAMLHRLRQRAETLFEVRTAREARAATLRGRLEELWGRTGAGEEERHAHWQAYGGAQAHFAKSIAASAELVAQLEIRLQDMLPELLAAARVNLEKARARLLLELDGSTATPQDDTRGEQSEGESLATLEAIEEAVREAEAREADRAPVLSVWRKRGGLLEEAAALQIDAGDPARLLDRGANSFRVRQQEERRRRLVEKDIPKLNERLRKAATEWEQAHGEPFVLRGRQLLATLDEERAREEREREEDRARRREAREQERQQRTRELGGVGSPAPTTPASRPKTPRTPRTPGQHLRSPQCVSSRMPADRIVPERVGAARSKTRVLGAPSPARGRSDERGTEMSDKENGGANKSSNPIPAPSGDGPTSKQIRDVKQEQGEARVSAVFAAKPSQVQKPAEPATLRKNEEAAYSQEPPPPLLRCDQLQGNDAASGEEAEGVVAGGQEPTEAEAPTVQGLKRDQSSTAQIAGCMVQPVEEANAAMGYGNAARAVDDGDSPHGPKLDQSGSADREVASQTKSSTPGQLAEASSPALLPLPTRREPVGSGIVMGGTLGVTGLRTIRVARASNLPVLVERSRSSLSSSSADFCPSSPTQRSSEEGEAGVSSLSSQEEGSIAETLRSDAGAGGLDHSWLLGGPSPLGSLASLRRASQLGIAAGTDRTTPPAFKGAGASAVAGEENEWDYLGDNYYADFSQEEQAEIGREVAREMEERRDELAQVAAGTRRQVRFKRGELLGAGSFGKVFLALDEDTGELMAVKEVDCHMAGESAIRDLEAEIKMLELARHPNIVAYYGVQRGAGISVLVEYCAGGSIASVILSFGALSEPVVSSYTRQILQGLDYLHKHCIVHRDVKCANCLLDADGNVKVADFGASRKMSSLNEAANMSMKGTPFFMAPEVVRQSAVGRQADIWSVGCCVVEMCTSKPPFASQFSNVAALLFHLARAVEPPVLPDNLSQACRDFTSLCFARDTAKRPCARRLLRHPFVSSFGKNSVLGGGSKKHLNHAHEESRQSNAVSARRTSALF